MTMTQTIGLREYKKNQTKQALLKSAYKLFKKHGYSKTSIDDITSDANFSPRTFFLHFDSKEDLLFQEDKLVEASLRDALNHRGSGVTALQTLKMWIENVVPQKEAGNSPINMLRRKIIDSDKSLLARQRISLNVIEGILTEAVAHDLGLSNDAMKPKIVAAAAIAIFGMLDEDTNHDRQSRKAQEYTEMAIDFLERGLESLIS